MNDSQNYNVSSDYDNNLACVPLHDLRSSTTSEEFELL